MEFSVGLIFHFCIGLSKNLTMQKDKQTTISNVLPRATCGKSHLLFLVCHRGKLAQRLIGLVFCFRFAFCTFLGGNKNHDFPDNELSHENFDYKSSENPEVEGWGGGEGRNSII